MNTSQEKAGADHHKHGYEIYVNGRIETVPTDRVSFDDAVKLAYGSAHAGPTVAYTVTYRNAAHDKQGSLFPGQSVEVKNGTVFDVERTDKS